MQSPGFALSVAPLSALAFETETVRAQGGSASLGAGEAVGSCTPSGGVSGGISGVSPAPGVVSAGLEFEPWSSLAGITSLAAPPHPRDASHVRPANDTRTR